jgi:hypothetical protein
MGFQPEFASSTNIESLRSRLRARDLPMRERAQAHLALGKLHDEAGRRREAQNHYRRVLALTDEVALRGQVAALFRRRFQRA